ncbi:DUF4091 domain-containing protein [Cohnella sp. JJ-181]|uniref:DUF4091 domain-containing protein n=1 Tax=Cohnella rhizoplanae TaxID=2974897 RepID=UPI0022FFBE4C|nr:DUF4091 domain-containing protein [Cohnella sp. JJ-181]CAI6085804.1 hypothetical protein COHCIP112018_04797 [Cohnella sp. JJ-181]
MTTTFSFRLTDSLEKVLPKRQPRAMDDGAVLSGLYGETLSFQLAYACASDEYDVPSYLFRLHARSSLGDRIRLRKVELVPSSFPCYGKWDDDYLTTEPGLLPDLLTPLSLDEPIKAIPAQWRSLWIDVPLDAGMTEDTYSIVLSAEKLDGTPLWEGRVDIRPVPLALPEQKLLHTEWFHADCLADYYKVPVFSEAHWRVIDNFMASAASHGVNMLLTPVFTPPLDTAVGGERTTIQLVDVVKEGDGYAFGFGKLERWVRLCQRNRIPHIEISHLFTQWGAQFAPKIMATADGRETRIFGWDTPATGEYAAFLRSFLPQLKEELKRLGVFENAWFHISDEPHDHQKSTYAEAKALVADLLADCKVVDALSSFDVYREGIVDKPIVCIDHIQPFIDAGVDRLWAYNCCVQAVEVSNRFMAMPSARNRILGVLLYLYRMEGFLHWGFNFYNAQYSVRPIDPYRVTDAGEGFPSGDPFLVYPAPDGTAYDSIRGMVLKEALYDLRALELLEARIGRAKVETLIQEGVQEKITFTQYPKGWEYIDQLRKKMNGMLR